MNFTIQHVTCHQKLRNCQQEQFHKMCIIGSNRTGEMCTVTGCDWGDLHHNLRQCERSLLSYPVVVTKQCNTKV